MTRDVLLTVRISRKTAEAVREVVRSRAWAPGDLRSFVQTALAREVLRETVADALPCRGDPELKSLMRAVEEANARKERLRGAKA